MASTLKERSKNLTSVSLESFISDITAEGENHNFGELLSHPNVHPLWGRCIPSSPNTNSWSIFSPLATTKITFRRSTMWRSWVRSRSRHSEDCPFWAQSRESRYMLYNIDHQSHQVAADPWGEFAGSGRFAAGHEYQWTDLHQDRRGKGDCAHSGCWAESREGATKQRCAACQNFSNVVIFSLRVHKNQAISEEISSIQKLIGWYLFHDENMS